MKKKAAQDGRGMEEKKGKEFHKSATGLRERVGANGATRTEICASYRRNGRKTKGGGGTAGDEEGRGGCAVRGIRGKREK